MTGRESSVTPVDERTIVAFMQRLGDVPVDVSSKVPGADVLWFKAQLIRRWDAQRRIERPMDLMEPIELAAGAIAAGLLLSWSVPSAFDWLPRLLF